MPGRKDASRDQEDPRIILASVADAQTKTVRDRQQKLRELDAKLRNFVGKTKVLELTQGEILQVLNGLLSLAINERNAFKAAKPGLVRSAAEDRLSAVAVCVRLFIEAASPAMESKAVAMIVHHILDTILMILEKDPDEGKSASQKVSAVYCEPIAWEYARALRILLEFQPHLENLGRKRLWEPLAQLCVDGVNRLVASTEDEDSGSSFKGSASFALSIRSSRSAIRDGQASQGSKLVVRRVAEELILCVKHLVSLPSAPILKTAQDLLSTLTAFLALPSSSGSQLAGFVAANHLLERTRIDDVSFTQQIVVDLVIILRKAWPLWYRKEKAHTAVRDEHIRCLLLLRPYLSQAMMREDKSLFREELSGLVAAIEADAPQLTIDELRLGIFHEDTEHIKTVSTPLFSLAMGHLHSKERRSDAGWAVLNILAAMYNVLRKADPQKSLAAQDDIYVSKTEPERKRQRVSDEFRDMLSRTVMGPVAGRVAALRTLVFISEQSPLHATEIAQVLDKLLDCSVEEMEPLAAWSFLAIASIASQKQATNASLTDRWGMVWKLGSRALTNAPTCRAASYAIEQMIRSQVVPSSLIYDLARSVARSMDLFGPCVMADSSISLLNSLFAISQQLSPELYMKAVENTASWLNRVYTPSRYVDVGYMRSTNVYSISDALACIYSCLGHKSRLRYDDQFSTWEPTSSVWIRCEEERDLVSYLLLTDNVASRPSKPKNSHKHRASGHLTATGPTHSTEPLILAHHISEITRVNELWDVDVARDGDVNPEYFEVVCKICCIAVCLAFCSRFKDTRRQTQLQAQSTTLLGKLCRHAASAQANVDIFFLVFSAIFTGMSCCSTDVDTLGLYTPSECETNVARAISEALEGASAIKKVLDDDDIMDIEVNTDSQASGPGNSGINDNVSPYGSNGDHSTSSLRACASLYAKAVSCLSIQHDASEQASGASAQLVNYVLSHSAEAVLSMRQTLVRLPLLGLNLDTDDMERLLDFFTTYTLSKYAFLNSDIALIAALDMMSSTILTWTNRNNERLWGLGVDFYEGCITILTSNGILSAAVQKRLATLFLQLCRNNIEYAQDTECASPRTSLFTLLQQGSISAQFFLASRIPSMFGMFVLSAHDAMFEDLQASLPAEAEWREGIAMRLLFLAELASVWPSLLRQCVYYLFETAGRIKGSIDHAAHCIEDLAKSLPVKTSKKLFTLFAPQLLHTWLEDSPLEDIPFAAFQYSSLDELLSTNHTEVTAQLTMRGSGDGWSVVSKALKMLPPDIVKRSFARCLAYSIGRDITQPQQGTTKTIEQSLRDMVGGKESFKALTTECFPAVLGYFYLTMQQDDPEDSWLEKRPLYSSALKALNEMKDYSRSTRPLPPSQQPSFRSKYLCDQIERLCRRVGCDPVEPWTPSSFMLVARMVLDAMDESLGPLHASLMIRKLRILVAMAGSVAYIGLPLEVLLHSLRPYVSQAECADDVIGLLQYLFHHGRAQLGTSLRSFTGMVVLLILRMRKHSRREQESTTLESQHRTTIQRMEKFQAWLVEQLSWATGERTEYKALIHALGHLRLPGNARQNSPESSLLLFLLQQWKSSVALCSKPDCAEAITILAENFESPAVPQEDCLGDDAQSLQYAPQIHDVLRDASFDDTFVAWAARVLGRAFAASGQAPQRLLGAHPESATSVEFPRPEAAVQSVETIAKRLSGLLFSRERMEAGLADYTLRTIMKSFSEASDALIFEQMLPETVSASIQGGTLGYEPYMLASHASKITNSQQKLKEVLDPSYSADIDTWAKELAVTTCQSASDVPIVHSLATILGSVPGLAVDLIPCVFHILLTKEAGAKSFFRTILSKAITEHLGQAGEIYLEKQRVFLKLLLYLRSQPIAGETTQLDRLKWLDVDLRLAADTAAQCGLPCATLLFAESVATSTQPLRRTTMRSSLSQTPDTPHVSNQVLLSVFEQLDEPDSYYGVEQPPSLSSVLSRLDYESNGIQGLMLRSAQMDSQMRNANVFSASDISGLIQSLSSLNLNSLTYALVSNGFGESAEASEAMVRAARSLQQWDIAPPDSQAQYSSITFNVFRELSHTSDPRRVRERFQDAYVNTARTGLKTPGIAATSNQWYQSLAMLAEANELLSVSSEEEMQSQWQTLQSRNGWMQLGRYEDVNAILSSRETTFAVLRNNRALLQYVHVSPKQVAHLQASSLLDLSRFSREQSRLQDALTASTSLSAMSEHHSQVGLSVSAAIQAETAYVLWDAGEATTSVRMLRDVLGSIALERQDIDVLKAGLLAQLGHQLAEARLEKPEEILSKYLRPAVADLKSQRDGAECGRVFNELAAFCDNELQNPGNIENFNRVEKLRNQKAEEITQLKVGAKESKKDSREKEEFERSLKKATQWFKIDDAEYTRLKQTRDMYIQQSLQNYLLALQASDEHDISVLRFFALWLDNAEDAQANAVVKKHLPGVPSWKFVLLMNQLMSSLEHNASAFQATLRDLILRICSEHPHHGLHHLFASSRRPDGNDPAAKSRYNAAKSIANEIQNSKSGSSMLRHVFTANRDYDDLACSGKVEKGRTREAVKNFGPALKVATNIPKLRVPPATISLALRPDGNYSDAPVVVRFSSTFDIMSGLSAPKALKAVASDGRTYKQLFKSGNDDLRQDAIMEQVFEEVSKMLRNHKATRQRDLKVRTYKVIPLSTNSGIIEFVPNSIPINEFLRPAHKKYHPRDISDSRARDEIRQVQHDTTDNRVAAYRRVCQEMHPVLRHFFFERFNDPDEWFERRTAYTRTTASVSMLGHVLGLGDRHCHNILLDEKTGEVVHIDLGVAFEAGRVLPIPELVPFRLTRDIVDGMGITRTEGVFRRCCEFTMDALREDKGSIMTLLNVLRYDPLYNWTVSPLRAKHMQDAQETGREADGSSSRKKGDEAGEADRALSVVEKKLSQTLSTAATVNELIQQATDERNLATLFCGWAAYF